MMTLTALQATCLLLTLLTICRGPAQVSAHARIYSLDTLDSIDSSRLHKLLVLAARLEKNQNHVQKRIMGFYGTEKNSDVIADHHHEPSKISTIWKKDPLIEWLVRDILVRKRSFFPQERRLEALQRQRRASAMESMHRGYSSFHNKLSEFLDELVTRLLPDSPTKLQYLTLIPYILPLDDRDFALNNKDGVSRKFTLVMKLTKLVFATIGNYLSDDDAVWLQTQEMVLSPYIALAEMSFTGLEIDYDEDVDSLITGVGGVSFNHQDPSVPLNIDDLQAAIGILQKHIKQDGS